MTYERDLRRKQAELRRLDNDTAIERSVRRGCLVAGALAIGAILLLAPRESARVAEVVDTVAAMVVLAAVVETSVTTLAIDRHARAAAVLEAELPPAMVLEARQPVGSAVEITSALLHGGQPQ